ncbi:hypothetical protein DPEC_G00167280 [Dallia pectoralis]|uniref:Uncharacterized protein n=1 Tax=Dallia pectoralis TaxID=75939 RepID=A0ACC2GHU4_DALPE|nr:hypothetical protein DPEC_G00167280 [Dallia pectoralis]
MFGEDIHRKKVAVKGPPPAAPAEPTVLLAPLAYRAAVVERLQMELRDMTMRLGRIEDQLWEKEAAFTKNINELFDQCMLRVTALEERSITLEQVVNQVSRDPPPAHRMPNFALESQGANLVRTRCSEIYLSRASAKLLGSTPRRAPAPSSRKTRRRLEGAGRFMGLKAPWS